MQLWACYQWVWYKCNRVVEDEIKNSICSDDIKGDNKENYVYFH